MASSNVPWKNFIPVCSYEPGFSAVTGVKPIIATKAKKDKIIFILLEIFVKNKIGMICIITDTSTKRFEC
jgi:hypothetical protein